MDKKVGIVGVASYVPEKILTNFDLEKMVDTSDQWIRERTGISERRIADDDMPTSYLATKAGKRALEDANIKPEELDLIIVSTVTPDQFFPSTACIVQKHLGAANATAFDISAACSGLIYAMSAAEQYIKTGFYKNALIIAADALSKITDWQDRNTCVLFGDGAGAFVLSEVEEGGILSIQMGSDGTGDKQLTCPACFFTPEDEEKRNGKKHTTWMNGGEIFKYAVKIMPYALEKAMDKAGITAEQIDWFVPHQANLRIISVAARKFDVDMDKFIVTLEKFGNTSASSIPIALDISIKSGKIKKGDKLAMAAFGGGLTWGSAVIVL
ncbi:MAG: ketoacyl-ACP synthase III [Oscillospiraceae bacterium]|nr:ketoacyl-ACP synthase III [Oscillospiraceae bacterium]MDD4414877.1 ketoacyl-ACP synthase III [Oscillospiraceae bacterium]